MRGAHEVHVRLLEADHVETVELGCRGTSQRRVDIVAAGSAQFDGLAVDEHTVFYDLHVTETDAFAEAGGLVVFLTDRDGEGVEVGVFGIPFQWVAYREFVTVFIPLQREDALG